MTTKHKGTVKETMLEQANLQQQGWPGSRGIHLRKTREENRKKLPAVLANRSLRIEKDRAFRSGRAQGK